MQRVLGACNACLVSATHAQRLQHVLSICNTCSVPATCSASVTCSVYAMRARCVECVLGVCNTCSASAACAHCLQRVLSVCNVCSVSAFLLVPSTSAASAQPAHVLVCKVPGVCTCLCTPGLHTHLSSAHAWGVCTSACTPGFCSVPSVSALPSRAARGGRGSSAAPREGSRPQRSSSGLASSLRGQLMRWGCAAAWLMLHREDAPSLEPRPWLGLGLMPTSIPMVSIVSWIPQA